jgi:hypothetical protein
MPEKVWIQWGYGEVPKRFEQDTPEGLNAFLEGVAEACAAWNIDDFRQFDTRTDVLEFLTQWNAEVAQDFLDDEEETDAK